MGRTFLVVTVGVGLGALNTGNNLLYLVLGMMLSLIVVSGVLSSGSSSRFGSAGWALTRRLPASRSPSGGPSPGSRARASPWRSPSASGLEGAGTPRLPAA